MIREVEIARLGHRGDGVDAAGEVFVPFALPGELSRGAVEGGRMEAPEIVRPSPRRVTPPCPRFGECGGCTLQHASDAFLAGWKRDRIAEALTARGIEGMEILPTVTSPPRSRRRAAFSGRRTKKTVTLGFHARGEVRVVDISPCLLLDPLLVEALPALAELVPFAASRKGEARIAATVSEVGLDVEIGGKPLDGPSRARLATLAGRMGWARLSWEGETLALARPPAQDFEGVRVVPPPGGFLQATREGEAMLRAAVVEAVGDAAHIADLFSGCGTFALPLARRAEVLAVESDAAALTALDAGWRAAGGALKQVRTETRDLFRRPLLPDELKRFDAVVIDPPRAGARAQSEALARSAVPRIAAVSCDPATFARDARILIDGGYVLDWVRPVDQFLWSGHVELAAAFRRR
jgi:23S rRNA (uracil1939-C5)-methyltransferase